MTKNDTVVDVGLSITQESFDGLASYWANSNYHLRWRFPFILPAWQKVWWQTLGAGAELYLCAVRQGEEVIGIAPLQVREGMASIIGSAGVCDYLDFIVTPEKERDFFNTLLDDLKRKGINQLDLGPLRPDSSVQTHLVGIAKSRGYDVLCHEEAVSVELDLPSSWEGYLELLSRKQRHEVQRKLRRLWEADKVNYRCVEASQGIAGLMDTFLKLFAMSRREKAGFMTPQMESFFRAVTEAMAEIRRLRLGILELDELPVAMIITLDYNDTVYLYNSAYDPAYSYLSVGLLSKVLCIKESIEKGRKKWDFLKGGEEYKYHLGGKAIPLSRCRIILTGADRDFDVIRST